jgi:predicted site-specific integrase-resolvase
MEYPPGIDEQAGPMGSLVYKKQAAAFLGVSTKTLERYVSAGRLKPYKNQINGRTYYDRDEILQLLGSRLPQEKTVVLYCRASPMESTAGKKGQSAESRLAAQVERCTKYCTAAGIRVDRTVSDIGKGETLRGRKGWAEIMDLVMRKQASMLVVETPDRICRWGMAEAFADFLAWHGVELHIIQPVLQLQEYRDELTEDLTNIVYQARKLMGT